MDVFPYPKGSTWRKWDLQIQTILDDGYIPLSSYFEELKVASPTDWARYVATVGGESNALLFDSKAYFNDTGIPEDERCRNYVRNFFAFLDIFKPDLECIGITDHNYYHSSLLDSFVSYALNSRCKVIPGAEINCGGIHVLLYFPSRLYGKPTLSGGIHAFLIKHGIDNRTNADGTLSTTSCDPKDLLDELAQIGGLAIFPHCNSNNGLFQERTRTDRTHLADIFNHQRVNLLQSRQLTGCESVAAYIKSNPALTSKFSCHISSDARSLRDYGSADAKGNYLWIKGDPTFEGLKQICFESQTRMLCSTERPEEKKSYFIVDSVRFIDNTAGANFSNNLIPINQNLTTIIGGKSTGKSLLLYYVAKTIDPEEVDARLKITESSKRYDFDDEPDFNFEVLWEDGQSTFLKTPSARTGAAPLKRKILYIPQRYLNTLSEANIKSKDALNEFVLKVLLQDPEMSAKYAETIKDIKAAFKSIPIAVADLFSDGETIRKTEEEIKQIGDVQGITNYIETLQKQADVIKASSGLSDGELETYTNSINREKDVLAELAGLTADKAALSEFMGVIVNSLSQIKEAKKETTEFIRTPSVRAKFEIEFKATETFDTVVKSALENVIATIDANIKFRQEELLRIKGVLAPLMAKVKLQDELKTKADSIRKEQQKLNDITTKSNLIRAKRAAYDKKTEAILESYRTIMRTYERLRNDFKTFESRFGEIVLGVHVGFRSEDFNNSVVKEFLNRNDLKRNIEEAEWGEEFVYRYDQNKHFQNMSIVFEGLLNAKISTIKSRTPKDAIGALLSDYFYLDFRILYKRDALDKMSPGKKGLVLLQLLIDLSDEEWPILLDQPEDDLDNRSVYEDLVAFLKRKKSKRQIIIVTHNPNLVVGADAEETIVANQSGQEVGRDNSKFRFEYISGALENTFERKSSEEPAILLRMGIREHVCEILEGGQEAFQKREQSYNFSN